MLFDVKNSSKSAKPKEGVMKQTTTIITMKDIIDETCSKFRLIEQALNKLPLPLSDSGKANLSSIRTIIKEIMGKLKSCPTVDSVSVLENCQCFLFYWIH